MRKLILIGLLFGLLSSCDKELKTPVPNYRVNFLLRLEFEDWDLKGSSNTKTFTEKRFESDRISPAGILVINGTGDGRSNINLYAYDLACPVEVAKDSTISRIVPNTLGEAQCPHCKSVYDISKGYGNPISGTHHSLRSYPVIPIPTGDEIYAVRN